MERRAFLTALFAGVGASFAVSQAQAFTRLAPQAAAAPDTVAPAPQFGVATPADMESVKVEKSWWRWRRRYWRRRYWWRRRW